MERNDALVHREDPDVSEGLQQLCVDEGIEVFTNTTVDHVDGLSGESVRLHATRDGSEIIVKGTDLLVASGRTPNTDGIGLELAGVERDDRSFVKVNEKLQTTAADVWAMGDCAGSPQFTHIAFDDFRVVRDNLAGGHRVTTGRQVPYLPVHRPGVGPGRPQRVGSETARHRLPAREDPDVQRAPRPDALRDARFHQGAGGRRYRSHPWLHGVRTGSRRDHGRRPGRHQCRRSLHGPRDAIVAHPTMAEGLIVLFSAALKTH